MRRLSLAMTFGIFAHTLAFAADSVFVVPIFSDGDTQTSTSNDALEPVEAFVALVKAGNWAEASILAKQLANRFEGLPRFDLYNGLRLVAENRYDEAIFAFERVLLFAPNQHRARLELGRAYYLLRNYVRAREALAIVLSSSPPASVRKNVNQLLSLIDEAENQANTQASVGGTVIGGWDGNANPGSNLTGDLDPNLLGLTELDTSSKPLESAFVQWSAFAQIQQPTSQSARLQFQFDFTQKNYIEPALSDTSALTIGSQISGQSPRWRTQIPASIQISWVEDDLWQGTVNLSVSQQYLLWGPLWVGVKLGTNVNVALDKLNISSANDLAGIVLSAEERGRVHTFSSVYLQNMRAGQENDHLEWRGFANRYQLSWQLPFDISSFLALEHQFQNYKAEDLFFTVNQISTDLKLRQDRVINLEWQGAWSPSPWLTTRTQVTWELVDSNIAAYGRDPFTISQAVTLQY